MWCLGTTTPPPQKQNKQKKPQEIICFYLSELFQGWAANKSATKYFPDLDSKNGLSPEKSVDKKWVNTVIFCSGNDNCGRSDWLQRRWIHRTIHGTEQTTTGVCEQPVLWFLMLLPIFIFSTVGSILVLGFEKNPSCVLGLFLRWLFCCSPLFPSQCAR